MSAHLPEGHRDGASTPAATGPRGLGAVGWARWAWRQLTSMRTALFLLLLLAVAAVPGSVVPQRGIDAAAVADYEAAHPVLAPWLERLGLFEVYASPWFSAIYLLLFVSLVGCVLPRTRAHWRALRTPPPRTPAHLHRLPEHRTAELAPGADPGAVLEAARSVLRRRRYRVADGGGAGGALGGASVTAQRGELRETGNLLFHLALVGVLVAVAVGGLVGYRGQAVVPQGKAFANSLTSYDSFDAGPLFDPTELPPFRFRLDWLTATFEEEASGNQFAAPRDFEAGLAVTDEPGAQERAERLRVNEPLRAGGASVYLAGNGYAPRVTVRDATGAVAFSDQVPFLPQDAFYASSGVVKVPDAAGTQIGLVGNLYPTYWIDEQGPRSIFPDARDPVLLFTAFTGDLGIDDGAPQNAYVLDTEGMTQLTAGDGQPFRELLRPGQTVLLPDGQGSVTLESVDRYAGLTIRHDPARGAALAFALAAIVGLMASLFVPRRRLWVRVVPAGSTAGSPGGRPDGAGGSRLEVGALARSEDHGLAAEADRVLAEVLAAAAAPSSRPDHGDVPDLERLDAVPPHSDEVARSTR